MIPKYPEVPPLTSEQIDKITEIVFLPQKELQPCDIIFIFGGSHPGLWETAARAYQENLGQIVIVTGGYKPGAKRHACWEYGDRPESHVIAEKLQTLGVPADAMILEDRSTNTLENVLFAQEVYDFSKVRRILMICKSFASGRQCRTLQKHLPSHITCLPYAFDTRSGDGPLITATTWMNDPQTRSLIFGEYLRIIAYGKKGDIEPLREPIQGLEDYNGIMA